MTRYFLFTVALFGLLGLASATSIGTANHTSWIYAISGIAGNVSNFTPISTSGWTCTPSSNYDGQPPYPGDYSTYAEINGLGFTYTNYSFFGSDFRVRYNFNASGVFFEAWNFYTSNYVTIGSYPWPGGASEFNTTASISNPYPYLSRNPALVFSNFTLFVKGYTSSVFDLPD